MHSSQRFYSGMNNLVYNKQVKSTLCLDIYSVCFEVNSLCLNVLKKLKNDFYVYEVNGHNSLNNEVIKVRICKHNKKAKKKDITFKDGSVVSMCHKNKNAEIYSTDLERLHELTYLYILSVLGKKLDLRGIHRIHASCVSFNKDKATLFVGASGIGKSHLAYFLNSETLSDDTIFLDAKGNVYPLLTRRGFSEKRSQEISNDEMYQLDRYKYGQKFLIPIKNKTAHEVYKLSEVFLLKSSKTVSQEKANLFESLKYFIKYQLIGLGTPQILEFFWEPGFLDFLVKTKIFFLRLRLCLRLAFFQNVMLLKTDRSEKVIKLINDLKS